METINDERARRGSARSAGLTVLTTLWSGVIGLGLLIVLTRLLSKGDVGRFALVYGLYEIIELFGALGIPTSLLYLIPRAGLVNARAIGYTAAVTMTGIGAILGLAVAVLSPWVGAWMDAEGVFEGLLRLLGLYIVLALPGALISPYLIATSRPAAALRITLLQQASRFLAVVVPAAAGASLSTIVKWLVISGLIPLVCLWSILLFVERGKILQFRRASLREQLAYGVPIAISVGVLRINRWVDRYVVGFLMPFDAVGVYANCSRELPVVRTIPHGATTGLIPQLTRLYAAGDYAGFAALWESLMAKVAVLAFPAFALTFVAAPDLVALLFTENYLSGVGIFRLYLLVLPLRLCIYGGILRAMGDTRTFVRVIILALVVNLVLNYPLYLLLGWYGPALATVLSEVLTIVLLTAKAASGLSESAWRIFPWRRLARTGLVAALSAAPALAVFQLPVARAVRLGIAVPVYAAVYLTLALSVGVMSRSDLQFLRSLVSGRSESERRASGH